FDGGTPRTGQALVRCLGATLSAACAGLRFLWCLFDRNKRFWHDYLSLTELILLPLPAKNASSPD
ncbi:MAG: RDD family protein, partial [Halioglobus sp.]|nr:RDD family protein [Halioglobus sp.]